MVVWAAAGWPVWAWYGRRMVDGSDEPWGLAALLVALGFVPWRRLREPLPALAAGGALACMSAAVAGAGVLPALVRGGLWMVAFGVLLGGAGPWAARGGLLLLSLPVVATAQFYLGYPLRVLTAACSVPLLHVLGYAVEREGTALRWAGERVLVDAPCSGIQMLWTGLFAACLLAALRGFGLRPTWRLGRAAAAIVALANVLRCVALFVGEVRGHRLAGWLHEGIGLVLFAGALVAIVGLARRIHRAASLAPPGAAGGPTAVRPVRAFRLFPAVGAVLCVVSVLLGSGKAPHTAGEAGEGFPGWPESFEGRPLHPVPLTARETRFAASFPGRIAVFTDGERTVLFRWVGRETRKLHPALHCLRGLGHAVQPGPVHRAADGTHWGTTIATRDHRVRRVRERIHDEAGREWTDVSAWWWDAWLGRSRGPWWAATVFEE